MRIKPWRWVILLLVGGCASPVDQKVQDYRQTQAHGLVAAYEQARGRDDLMDMCVKSNLVSAAYQDARQSGDALAWRTRSTEDCKAARAGLEPMVLDAGKSP